MAAQQEVVFDEFMRQYHECTWKDCDISPRFYNQDYIEDHFVRHTIKDRLELDHARVGPHKRGAHNLLFFFVLTLFYWIGVRRLFVDSFYYIFITQYFQEG